MAVRQRDLAAGVEDTNGGVQPVERVEGAQPSEIGLLESAPDLQRALQVRHEPATGRQFPVTEWPVSHLA